MGLRRSLHRPLDLTRLILFVSAAMLVVAGTTAVVRLAGDADASALPSCARPAATIALPGRLPRTLPFPPGTVFTRRLQNRTTHGAPGVEGRMPVDVAEATRLLQVDLPKAGYTLKLLQKTPGREVVAYYEGKGFGGWFHVSALPACRGATSFWLSARTTLFGRGFSE